MNTTLLQPYHLLGAAYAGFLIGIVFSVLRLFIPQGGHGRLPRIAAALWDALFYVIATVIAAWALLRFADGQIRLFMLLTMAAAAFVCVKTAGWLLWIIFRAGKQTNGKTKC